MKLIMVITALTILVIALSVMVLHYFKQMRSEGLTTPPEPPLNFTSDNLTASAPTQKPFDAVRWEQKNEWLVEGQADDRRPMNGSVAVSTVSASAHRADARRSHQVNYKEWSKQRHD